MALRNATIIFDLDGTIADTAPDLVDAANAALTSFGYAKATAETIRKGVGYGARSMIKCALDEQGQDADAAPMAELAAALVSHYETRIADKTTLFPGFVDVARDLKSQGARLALCTNKTEALMKKLLAAFCIDSLFDAAAGRDTFAFHKPDPRHIVELLRLCGGSPSFAVMVGDSEADIAAARGAGIPVVAVRFGYARVPAEALGADAVLERFSELGAIAVRLLTDAPVAVTETVAS